MAKPNKHSKNFENVNVRHKYVASSISRKSLYSRLKAMKKRKIFRAAIKLRIRHGIKKKDHNLKAILKKNSTEPGKLSDEMLVKFVNIDNKNDIKKALSKKVPLKPKVKNMKISSMQATKNDSKLRQGKQKIILPMSLKEQLKCSATNTQCSNKRVKSKLKHVKDKTDTTNKSVFSMFKYGFDNSDLTRTPNDRSHILQSIDIGANRSIAEFSKCGISGPQFYKYNANVISTTELIEENSEDEVMIPTQIVAQNSVLEDMIPTQIVAQSSALEDMLEETSIFSSMVSFYSVPKNKFIITLKNAVTFYLEGELKIHVLSGSLKVLGHIISASNEDTIYSPSGFCKLSLQTVESELITHETNLQSILLSQGLNTQNVVDIISNLNEIGCVAVIEKTSSTFTDYLASHCLTYLYSKSLGLTKNRPFHNEEKILHCLFDFENKKASNLFQEPVEWNQLANYIAERNLENGDARVMICGGKSVGKSTLLRFLINQSLVTRKEVLCLDFDPGQTEFTVPGSVSVVRICKPLLGPSFTHIHYPERMVFVGDVDMSKCPYHYLKSVQHIVNYCLEQPEFENMLWFVNTMGFNKGVGVDLTTNLVRIVGPTDVVQIQSKSAQRNYPDLLSHEHVLKRKSVLQHLTFDENNHLNYTLHLIPSVTDKNPKEISDWGLSSKKIRSIMVSAYFYPILKSPRYSLTDILPYKIPLSQLILGICHEIVNYSELLCVMNANLVALCAITEDDYVLRPDNPEFPRVLTQPDNAHCLGYGVVRGIDMKEKMLYLITPLPEENLRNVNCLLSGSVTLPASMFVHSSSGLGHIPYVTLGSGQATSNRITRRFVPPSRHRVKSKKVK